MNRIFLDYTLDFSGHRWTVDEQIMWWVRFTIVNLDSSKVVGGQAKHEISQLLSIFPCANEKRESFSCWVKFAFHPDFLWPESLNSIKSFAIDQSHRYARGLGGESLLRLEKSGDVLFRISIFPSPTVSRMRKTRDENERRKRSDNNRSHIIHVVTSQSATLQPEHQPCFLSRSTDFLTVNEAIVKCLINEPSSYLEVLSVGKQPKKWSFISFLSRLQQFLVKQPWRIVKASRICNLTSRCITLNDAYCLMTHAFDCRVRKQLIVRGFISHSLTTPQLHKTLWNWKEVPWRITEHCHRKLWLKSAKAVEFLN